MTPQQFLAQLKQREPEPAYLFLGPEPYQREFCRRARIERVLPGPQDREGGLEIAVAAEGRGLVASFRQAGLVLRVALLPLAGAHGCLTKRNQGRRA